MVILIKKITAASLVEVLVASVLILVIFTISSFSLNNLFKSNYQRNTFLTESRLKELQYLYIHDQLQLPYSENFADGEIYIDCNAKTKCDFIWNSKTKEVHFVVTNNND